MRSDEERMQRVMQALKNDVPDDAAIRAAAVRCAHALEIETDQGALAGAIQDCAGVQRLFVAYRAGTLNDARKQLVDAHLHECGACLHAFREGHSTAAVNWTAPKPIAARHIRPMTWGWAAASCAALLLISLFVYRMYWQIPPGVRAAVVSIDGAAFVIDAHSSHRIAPGAELEEGTEMRTGGDSHAVLRLADGSLVEMNQRSALAVGARGRDMTVRLNRGAVIVQAAQRTAGHLYIRTPDCRVAVTHTVFSVDAGMKGSRVAVLQGSVRVMRVGANMVLHPGEQMATSDNLAPEPLEAQFTWSPQREKYIGILAQLALVEHKIARIPFPQPRYTSDLLARVPAGTQFYLSIPNLGDFLKQANGVFQDQLNASPELQQWWTKTHKGNQNQLNDLIGKINDISQYIGDEVVVIGIPQSEHATVAMLADVKKSGLKDELQQQFGGDGAKKLTVFDPAGLAAADSSAAPGAYALVRDKEVVFAGSVAVLKQISAQLDAGASGFAATDFGKEIQAAYGRGAGIILAADLQSMIQTGMSKAPKKGPGLASTGLGDLKYLIAEHREVNGAPANHLNVQFTGTRQRIASWLGSPGPIGSLQFVSSNASIAVASLTKDPAAIADDLMAMATAGGKAADWNDVDSKLQIDVRNDLMASLGGDFAFALDGPVLPTPSWKLVVEVNNPTALQNALERMMQAIQSQTQGAKHVLAIDSEMVDGQRYYRIRDVNTGTEVADYTYADGYLVMAASRAILMDALKTPSNGNSLAQATAFRALLPKDENENYSAVLYQNLSPVLTPLLSQFSGQTASAIQQLAADSRPTVICAWGKDNRIEVASDSRLFGFDFLTLGAILHGNKPGARSVVQ